jgi:glycosyltransferase involved in cell wall biosynthesis
VRRRVTFAVPGNLDSPTGGYAYDKRIIAQLGHLGWDVDVLDLGSGFPVPSEPTRTSAHHQLRNIPAGQPIIIDGLAFGVLPDTAVELADRHPLLALVHHPLAMEWGLSASRAEALCASERAALAHAHGVVVTSPTTARLLASDYDVPIDRITVAKPGNDPVHREPARRHANPHLLAVGAASPRKAYDILIEALAGPMDQAWQLTIVGDLTRSPDTARDLRTSIAKNGLEERIILRGAVTNAELALLYNEANIFVLPSRYEGYGMAYAEALAYGLPIIGTTAGAIPETVPSLAGLLVPAGNVTALREALRELITNQRLRQQLSDGALSAAAALPSWSEAGATFSSALEKLG